MGAPAGLRRHRRGRRAALRRGGYTVVTSLDPDVQATALSQSLKVYAVRQRAGAADRGGRSPAPVGCWRWPSTGTTAWPRTRPGSGTTRTRSTRCRRRRRHRRLPGRLDVQAVHHAGRAGAGHAAVHRLRRAEPADRPGSRPSGARQLRRQLVPGNANPAWMDGYRTMWTGFGRSVNTYFVWLERAGRRRPRWSRWRSGSASRSAPTPTPTWPRHGAANWGAFTLGVSATTPLDLANAYATVAAEGTYCAPMPVRVDHRRRRQRRWPPAQPELPAGGRADVAPGRRRRGPLPGRPAVGVRPVQRRHRRRACRRISRPPGGRQDRQLGAERDRDVRRLHPAGRGRPASPPTRTTPATPSARRCSPRWSTRSPASSPPPWPTPRSGTSSRPTSRSPSPVPTPRDGN